MRKLSAIAVLGAGLCMSAPALADDGTAQLGVGGLVFTKSADIRMAREDLTVTPDRVKIRFAFANDGKDQDVLIAFPLPDLDMEAYQSESLGVIGKDPVNFVGFTTTVDGKRIVTKVEQKALLKGKDVSAIIRAAGLPLNLAAGDGYERLQHLTPAQKAALVKAGVLAADPTYPTPLWSVQTRFYWTQHFAHGQTLLIDHGYTPISGGLQFTFAYDTGRADPLLVKTYCIDPPMIKRLRAMINDPKLRSPEEINGLGGPLWGTATDYILWTANTWKGPIGHFHLTLDKLDARAVLSVCWKGDLKKTGPTTFEFTADHFAPTQDIQMLVLR